MRNLKSTVFGSAFLLMFILVSSPVIAADYYLLTGQHIDRKNTRNTSVKIPVTVFKTSKYSKGEVREAWLTENEEQWSCCYYDLSTKVYGPFSSWNAAKAERNKFIDKMLDKWPDAMKKDVIVEQKLSMSRDYIY